MSILGSLFGAGTKTERSSADVATGQAKALKANQTAAARKASKAQRGI